MTENIHVDNGAENGSKQGGGSNEKQIKESRRIRPAADARNTRKAIEWLGAKGKTQINTRPFVIDIAKTVSSLAYKMPSYHGDGLRWTDVILHVTMHVCDNSNVDNHYIMVTPEMDL